MTIKFPHAYLFRDVSPSTLARKKAEGVCRHYGCTNQARRGGSDCETCKSRKSRLANPVRYAFNMLKVSAAKRHIPFELTYEEFTEFSIKTGYVERMGRGPADLTVDRIRSSEGYRIDNIRALTYEDNVAKRLEGMEYPFDPIAKLIHDFKGTPDINWRAFRSQAGEVYDLITRLQGYEVAPEIAPDEDDDTNPF